MNASSWRWVLRSCPVFRFVLALPTPARRRALAVPVMVVLGGLILGCGDEDASPGCPETPLGLIQGHALGGGRAVAGLLVLANPVGGEVVGHFWTETDSAGSYSLTVPAGEYTLITHGSGREMFYAREGICARREQADTLTAGRGVVCADLLGGAIEVSLTVPADRIEPAYGCRAYLLEGEERLEYSKWEYAEEGRAVFEFPFLPPGTYILRCEDNDGFGAWLPATYDMGEATRLSVETSSVAAHASALPQPAMLTLDVQGSWRTLELARPSVKIYGADSEEIDRISLDALGSGRFPVYAPLSLRLLLSIGGVERWVGGWTFAEASTFDLAPGDAPLQVSCSESAILCTLEAPGPTLSYEARYYLYDGSGRLLTPRGCSPSRVRPAPLPNLPPGTYFLQVDPYGWDDAWCEQWFDQGSSLASATPIEIPAEGIVVPVTMRLVEGGKISGRILEGDGSPYDGPVRIWKHEEPARVFRSVESHAATGAFEFVGLPDGDYLLSNFVGWHRYCWFPGTMEKASAVPIQVEGFGEVRGVDWQIPSWGF